MLVSSTSSRCSFQGEDTKPFSVEHIPLTMATGEVLIPPPPEEARVPNGTIHPDLSPIESANCSFISRQEALTSDLKSLQTAHKLGIKNTYCSQHDTPSLFQNNCWKGSVSYTGFTLVKKGDQKTPNNLTPGSAISACNPFKYKRWLLVAANIFKEL